jgi:diguanylate cyclase (GGDEF)-like protein
MIDLDHFKRFNDSYGHYAGDTLLRDCADAWALQVRGTDVLARIGGEEFALALPSCELNRAIEVVDRLRHAMPNGETFSSGIARWNGTETAQHLLMRADMAMYAAKAAGRNSTVRAEVAPATTITQDTR